MTMTTEEKLAAAAKLLKRFENEFEATGPNDSTLLRDYYEWTGEPHYQGEYGWNHGQPETSGPDAEEVFDSVNQDKRLGEVVAEGLQDFVAGPYGCRCTTLQQRVTGDGCDMCNSNEVDSDRAVEQLVDSIREFAVTPWERKVYRTDDDGFRIEWTIQVRSKFRI